ncbi:MAG: hypothetical protein ABIG67_00760 [Pseudomonadota bacterium]
MGKKFVICEVHRIGNDSQGYNAVGSFKDDLTWIDHSYIIDGDRLREATPLAGDRYFCPKVGWTIAPMNSPMTALILDPPKPEGDEWERWKSTMPLRATGGIKRGTLEYYTWIEEKLEWLAQMPRKP